MLLYTQPTHGLPHLETAAPRLAVSDLSISFGSDAKTVHGVNFTLAASEIFGIVGESGCGKSVTCRTIMGLLPHQASAAGTLLIAGQNFNLSDQKQLQEIRGHVCAMIFQDPMSALNPLMKVRRHLALHLARNGQPYDREACADLLRTSGMANPDQFLDAYPHQLSGGQCQRVAIALALSGRPDVLIADEPTTALDVVLQAQILSKLREICRSTGMSIILISHDIGVVAKYCDRAAVMYAGEIVETGPVNALFRQPSHPYTQGLINALPLPARRGTLLEPIPGEVPKPGARANGCTFAPRCRHANASCTMADIPIQPFGATDVRCLLSHIKAVA